MEDIGIGQGALGAAYVELDEAFARSADVQDQVPITPLLKLKMLVQKSSRASLTRALAFAMGAFF